MKGYLKKRSPFGMHALQSRWFVLADGMISYYKTESDEAKGQQPKGIIPLDNIVKASMADAVSLQLDVGYRTFFLVAASAADADAWYRAVKQATATRNAGGSSSGGRSYSSNYGAGRAGLSL